MTLMITGGTGMLGNACKRIWPDALFVSSSDCDLRKIDDVQCLFEQHKPDIVIHLAADVGGLYHNINDNNTIYYNNILINTNLTHVCSKNPNIYLIATLSTCIFPAHLNEFNIEDVNSGPPHKTNMGYSYSKRALRDQCDMHDWNYVIPANIYGPHDNFDVKDGHVIPALIHKIYLAKESNTTLQICGNGIALRQFVYVDDVALMLKETLITKKNSMIVGEEISIRNLVSLLCFIMNFDGPVFMDETFSNGISQKKGINCHMGQTSLIDGLKLTCDWFIKNYPNIRGVKII